MRWTEDTQCVVNTKRLIAVRIGEKKKSCRSHEFFPIKGTGLLEKVT
jgi:hypothetical protein